MWTGAKDHPPWLQQPIWQLAAGQQHTYNVVPGGAVFLLAFLLAQQDGLVTQRGDGAMGNGPIACTVAVCSSGSRCGVPGWTVMGCVLRPRAIGSTMCVLLTVVPSFAACAGQALTVLVTWCQPFSSEVGHTGWQLLQGVVVPCRSAVCHDMLLYSTDCVSWAVTGCTKLSLLSVVPAEWATIYPT
jgi:hypothetical protein